MRKMIFFAMAIMAVVCVFSFVACSNNDEEKNLYWLSVSDASTNYNNNSLVSDVVTSLVEEFQNQYGKTALTSSEANGYFETLCAKAVSTVSSNGSTVFPDTYCTLVLQHSSSSPDGDYPTVATKKVTFTSNAERSNSSIYFFVTTMNVMEMMSKVDLEFYNPLSGETVSKTITSADNKISEEACKKVVSAYNSAITGEPYFVYYYNVTGLSVGQELKATASWTVDQSKAASYGDSESMSIVTPRVYYCISDGIKVDTNLSSVKMSTGTASKIFSSFSEKTKSSSMTKTVDF